MITPSISGSILMELAHAQLERLCVTLFFNSRSDDRVIAAGNGL